MKHLLVYHSGDLDGKCSAAIAMRAIAGLGHPVLLHGINYGQPFPWDDVTEDTDVTMVDFSLQPFRDMVRLSKKARHFTWIDHHKTAIRDYESQSERWDAALSLDKAGCELTWEYYWKDTEMPRAVRLLGRYDVWKWQNVPGALEFQYGMRGVSSEPDAVVWDTLLYHEDSDEKTEAITNSGRHILQYVNKQNRIYAKSTSFPLIWEGLRFVASNAQLTNSALFDSVFDPAHFDGMLAFAYRKGMWHVHLYCSPEVIEERKIDMGALAKKYGGGGHPGAAGFQCRELPFELPLQATH